MTINEWKLTVAYEPKRDVYQVSLFRRRYQAHRDPDPWSCVVHVEEYSLDGHVEPEVRLRQFLRRLLE